MNNAPRNLYRCADGSWVAVSTSATSVAERVMRLVGHPEVVDEPWFATGAGRVGRVDDLDGWVADWIAARSLDEVLDAFAEAGAAVAPVYSARQIVEDPHLAATDMITTVQDDSLGAVRMHGVLGRLSETPGEIRFPGRPPGHDTETVLSGLGYSHDQIENLRAAGVIG